MRESASSPPPWTTSPPSASTPTAPPTSLALNWAQNGYEVDPDSVRAEEWINAFNYGYDQPRRDDSFAVATDVVTHPLDSRLHLARIAFQAPEMDYDATPVNVTLVLDASGSMSTGNRVNIAREAAETIRYSLRDQDRIAIVQVQRLRATLR